MHFVVEPLNFKTLDYEYTILKFPELRSRHPSKEIYLLKLDNLICGYVKRSIISMRGRELYKIGKLQLCEYTNSLADAILSINKLLDLDFIQTEFELRCIALWSKDCGNLYEISEFNNR